MRGYLSSRRRGAERPSSTLTSLLPRPNGLAMTLTDICSRSAAALWEPAVRKATLAQAAAVHWGEPLWARLNQHVCAVKSEVWMLYTLWNAFNWCIFGSCAPGTDEGRSCEPHATATPRKAKSSKSINSLYARFRCAQTKFNNLFPINILHCKTFNIEQLKHTNCERSCPLERFLWLFQINPSSYWIFKVVRVKTVSSDIMFFK